MERRTIVPGEPFYKGNLHTHTTNSDGVLSPEEAIAWYREHGYDFVSITDHWSAQEYAARDDIVVIPGVELDGMDPELGSYHVVGLDIARSPERQNLSLRQVTDYISEMGGISVLCHPYWCGMPSWAVGRAQGVFAVEVFNVTCEVSIAKGLSSVHWDDSLASGRRLWGLAVDDAHWRREDYGGGWVMVQAEKVEVGSLLGALKEGRFYASSGPGIVDFCVSDGVAYAETSPARRISFVCDGPRGRCFSAENGDGSLTTAEYRLPEGVTYVRLEVDDEKGKRAWSNPIFVN